MPAKSEERSLKDLFPGRIIKPFMFYADVWKRSAFDQPRMQAYKQLESENQIQIMKVTFSKATQMVVIEYKANMPHEWVIDELKKRVVRKAPEQLSLV